jgi:hypothetical protein
MLKLAPHFFALVSACAALAGPALAKAERPVVVELFTSQGCGACTKANSLIAELAERKDVLPITFPIDYWDYLGWKDTFAKPEFAARQRAYMKAAGQREVFTPQVVVDGAAQPQKTEALAAPTLIKIAAKAHEAEPAMQMMGKKLAVGSGAAPEGGADVWLVRYDSQPQETQVKDGENRGLTVVYRNVATGLVKLGPWSGKPKTYALPKADERSAAKSVILLQGRVSGKILGVLKP